MKYLFFTLFCLFLSSSAFSQKFKISGTIDGVTNDTLIVWYMYYNPDRVDVTKKVPVRNGKFKFSTKLKDYAVSASLALKSRPSVELYFEMVPNEEALFSGRIDPRSGMSHWDGSLFYQQYEQIILLRTALNQPYDTLKAEKNRLIENGLSMETVDSIMKPKYEALTERNDASAFKYIDEHASEDATATLSVICGFDNIPEVIDRLTPEVRNGRMKFILEDKLKFYDHYSEVKSHMGADDIVGTDTVGVGYDMPELGLKDIDGNVLSFKSLRGKYVILDFWGSWCRWCIEEFPELKKYYKKHHDRLEIVGIDCNDKEPRWKAAVEKHQVPWLHVRSADGIAETKFQVKGFPFKAVISPEGKILRTELGSSEEEFYSYLNDLLK